MDFFGLDIGTYSIKIVQLEKKRDGHRLVAFGSGPSTGKGLLSESEADLTALATVIKKIHREAKIKTRHVVAALPQDQVFTRTVVTPKLSEEELRSALKWEAEQFIPIPLAEVTIAHQVVGRVKEAKKEKQRVLLVAAPNRLIEKMTTVLEAADLTPISLETEIIAIARSLVPPNGGPVLVADLGARATDAAIVEKNLVTFVQSIGAAGETLTRAMETQLGLGASQAEAYKKAYGADPQKLEGRLLKVIEPVLAKIIGEIEKTIQFFQSQSGKKVTRVILTGGTAALPDIASLLTKKLNLEIQVGDPFGQVIKGDLAGKVPSQGAFIFAVAAGLALKELG